MLFHAYAFAVLILLVVSMVPILGGLVSLSVMAGSENKACELHLAHDLSSSVNAKLRVYLTDRQQADALVICQTLQGYYVDKYFLLVERTTSHFYLYPSRHQRLKNDLVWLPAAEVGFAKTRAYCRNFQTHTRSHHSLCRRLPLLLLLLLRVLTQ